MVVLADGPAPWLICDWSSLTVTGTPAAPVERLPLTVTVAPAQVNDGELAGSALHANRRCSMAARSAAS